MHARRLRRPQKSQQCLIKGVGRLQVRQVAHARQLDQDAAANRCRHLPQHGRRRDPVVRD